MKYLFVDTNNFIACSLLIKRNHSPETVKKLSELLDNNKINLILPEIVEIEYCRVIDGELAGIESRVNEFIKYVINFGNIVNENVASYLGIEKDKFLKAANSIYKKREISSGVAKKRIRSIFDSGNTIKISLTPEIFINAYKRALAGEKPFKFKYCSECKEPKNIIDADCLIFESILSKKKEINFTDLIFCSDNKADFADKKREDIMALELATELGGNIKYYRNLGDALDSEFKADIKQVEKENIDRSLNYLRFSSITEEAFKNMGGLEQALRASVSGIENLKLKPGFEEMVKSMSLVSDYFKNQVGGIVGELEKIRTLDSFNKSEIIKEDDLITSKINK